MNQRTLLTAENSAAVNLPQWKKVLFNKLRGMSYCLDFSHQFHPLPLTYSLLKTVLYYSPVLRLNLVCVPQPKSLHNKGVFDPFLSKRCYLWCFQRQFLACNPVFWRQDYSISNDSDEDLPPAWFVLATFSKRFLRSEILTASKAGEVDLVENVSQEGIFIGSGLERRKSSLIHVWTGDPKSLRS